MTKTQELIRIQEEGAAKAEELNENAVRPEPGDDLVAFCPYRGDTIEAMAWGAGYWSYLAGHYFGMIRP